MKATKSLNSTKRLASRLLVAACVLGSALSAAQTLQPFYGILTQPLNLPAPEIAMARPSELSMSYIMKAYYQMVSSGGALSLAIPYDLPMRKLIEILPLLNGIVIPDGLDSVVKGKEYSTKVAFIINWAKERNDDGFFFSVIAAGKGFRELMNASAGKDEIVQDCSQPNWEVHSALNIDWVQFKSTNLLKELQQSEVEHALTNPNSVALSHNCSIPVAKFKSSSLDKEFHLVASGTTNEGDLNFVALVEHKKYPFVGMQFAPESSAYAISKGHAKDRRTIRLYRDLVSLFLLSDPTTLTFRVDDLPMAAMNLVMNKDIPVHGLLDQDQIYLYRRWASGRDIDMPN